MTVFLNLSYIELHKVSDSNLKSRVNLISKKAVHLVVNDFQMQICKISSTTIIWMVNQSLLKAYWNVQANRISWQAPKSNLNECLFNATTLSQNHWKLYCVNKHFSNKLNSVRILHWCPKNRYIRQKTSFQKYVQVGPCKYEELCIYNFTRECISSATANHIFDFNMTLTITVCDMQ